MKDATYHKRVREWAVERLCDRPHVHPGEFYDSYQEPIQERTYALAECFDMDDQRLPDWDFHFDYEPGYSYSEYTAEPDRADLYVTVALKCGDFHPNLTERIFLADKEDLTNGEFSFAKILRELTQ